MSKKLKIIIPIIIVLLLIGGIAWGVYIYIEGYRLFCLK